MVYEFLRQHILFTPWQTPFHETAEPARFYNKVVCYGFLFFVGVAYRARKFHAKPLAYTKCALLDDTATNIDRINATVGLELSLWNDLVAGFEKGAYSEDKRIMNLMAVAPVGPGAGEYRTLKQMKKELAGE